MNDIIVDNIKKRNEEIKKGVSSEIKTGLVVQGGAMRGIYSMAVLMGLEEMGFSQAFDHVVGSSAGAINGAYFIAQQSRVAVSIYLDDLSDKRFVNFSRLKKIVDIDYMVDDVVKKEKPLNADNVRNSFATLHTALTDYHTAQAVYVTNKDKEVDIFETIRATAAMPILYNKTVRVNGSNYIDGGIVDGIPLFKAIELGCTDLIVVLTRKPDFRRKAPSFLIRLLEEPFLRKYPPLLKKRILEEDKFFNKTMDYLETYNNRNSPIRIMIIYPGDMSKLVSRTTKNRDELLRCALMGRNDIISSFGYEELIDTLFSNSKFDFV